MPDDATLPPRAARPSCRRSRTNRAGTRSPCRRRPSTSGSPGRRRGGGRRRRARSARGQRAGLEALADVSDDAAAALRAARARSLAERLAAPPRTDARARRAFAPRLPGMYPAYPDHDADGAERADAPASDGAAASETKAAEADAAAVPEAKTPKTPKGKGRVVPVDSSPKKTPPSTPNGTWRSAAVVTSSRRVQRRKRHRERLRSGTSPSTRTATARSRATSSRTPCATAG
ncbi:voltage-gated potassium channel [Aureococcus anophagefferens]|nr:voltage-gated potassium channel [Aureococcus anophagefferens]